MLIKTILNKCHKFKSFVYGKAYFAEDEGRQFLNVEIVPRKSSKVICSKCHQPAPGYDKLEERKFEFIPVWGFSVFFIYTMRRVECPTCGVREKKCPGHMESIIKPRPICNFLLTGQENYLGRK